MTLTKVVGGQIAAVVTSLEMRVRPQPAPLPESALRLVRWEPPKLAAYRMLFLRVGSPWLWFSRAAMDDMRLAGIIHDPAVAIWAVIDARGIEIGLLELDFRTVGECEISFFGVVPELAGKGNGRWLMAHALAAAWGSRFAPTPVTRVWVHTCSLDHPRALGFYVKCGFTPYERAIETFPDPRLIGLLPREAAPQIPLIEAD